MPSGDSQDPTGTVQDCVPYYGHGFDPADPAWGAAFPLIANWVGKYYHDDQIFSEHYEQITAHIDNLIGTAKINDADGLLTYGIWGDWCPPSGCVACRTPNLSSNNSVLVSSFYYISELRIVAEYAGILGKTADQEKYSGLATAAGEAFNKHFYKAASHTYDENRTCGEYLSPQTTISLAAALNLIPEADFDSVMDTLVDDVAAHGWHLNVGIVGIKYLLPTLSAAGRGDVALMIAQAKTPPSYIYMVEQGATTLWETWTGTRYVPASSRNHIMFGSNSDWYFKYLAGLNMAETSRGWQQLVLKPEVWNAKRRVSVCANLSSTQASIDSPRGVISAQWSCVEANPDACALVGEDETAALRCDAGSTIKSVAFASFGTPTGSCASRNFADGNCSAKDAEAIVAEACLGKETCAIDVSSQTFKGDPCSDVPKELAVRVTCTAPPAGRATPKFTYDVVIPTGTTAEVVLPQFGSKGAEISEAAAPHSNRFIQAGGDPSIYFEAAQLIRFHVPACDMCKADLCAHIVPVSPAYVATLTAGGEFNCSMLPPVPGAPVWKAGAYVPGVPGVTGASVDPQGNVAISVGSGSYAFVVST